MENIPLRSHDCNCWMNLSAKERRDRERTFHPADWLCSTEDYSRLVDRGFRIMENMDTEQRTAMVRKAVENKDLDLIKAMMDNGLQPFEFFRNRLNDDEWWLLFEVIDSCENNQECVDIVSYLMDKGCDALLSVKDILPRLIKKDLWKIISGLLCHKIDAQDLSDLEVQREVGASLCPEMIDILEKYGLRYHIEVTNAFMTGLVGGSRRYEEPTRSAEHYRKHQIPMLKSLIAKGMKIPEDIVDEPLLHDPPIHNLLRFCPEKSDAHLCQVVSLLLDSGHKIGEEDWIYHTVLNLAVEKHKVKVVKLLLERGADVNYITPSKATALSVLIERSCSLENFELFTSLIQSGADVNYSREPEMHNFVPRILAICMNQNMTYGRHVDFLLNKSNVYVHDRLNHLHFEVFQPFILYRLVQVGLSGLSLLSAVLRHALKTQTRRGYDLVRQVCPSIKKLLEDDDLLDLLKYEISRLSSQIIMDFKVPASLLNWSACALRHQLVDTSNNISILPRIRQLAREVPLDLRPKLTLDLYMVKDEERCLLTPQYDQDGRYSFNMEVLQLAEEEKPFN